MARRLGRFEAADDDVRVDGVEPCLDGCQPGQHTISLDGVEPVAVVERCGFQLLDALIEVKPCAARHKFEPSRTSLAEQSHQGGLALAVTVSNRDSFEKQYEPRRRIVVEVGFGLVRDVSNLGV
jgi:hypothetical protein